MLKIRLSGGVKSRLSSVLAALLVAITGLAHQAAYAQLPFDPALIDQLTPEQRQRALDTLGIGSGGVQPTARADGSFRDGRLSNAGPRSGIGGSTAFTASPPGGAPSSRYNLPLTFSDSAAFGRRVDGAQDKPVADGELRPFGYDLFQNGATTFAPAADIPVPSDYVIGPGDSLHIQLFGAETGNYSLLVGRDGQINFPKLGPIHAAGQRFEDFRNALAQRVARELVGAQISVSLGDLKSIQVFLLGDVNQPGSYTVSSLATMTNLLFSGGGIAPLGSLRKVQLKRGGRLVRTLDLYALLLQGDSSADDRLQPGDVVFVPPVGPRIGVAGEVKRPAIYELLGEKSVAEAVALAGGVPATGNTAIVQLGRVEANTRTLKQLDLAKAGDLALAVRDGDLLRVTPVAPGPQNAVRVLGNVKYAGSYQWSDGYLLKDLLAAAQLLPSSSNSETYLAMGLVERTDLASGIRNWLSFNVQDVVSGRAEPFAMQRDDLVVILRRDDIAYLGSKEVRAVAGGDFSNVASCPALEGVAELINSERSLRLIKAFTSESQRETQNLGSNTGFDDSSDSRGDNSGVRNRDSRSGSAPFALPGAAGSAANALNLSAGDASKLGAAGAGGASAFGDPSSSQPTVASALKAKSFVEDVACPPVFRAAPRALQYLIEESVAVYGEVRRPGLYPVAPNTPLRLLIETAGGLSNESDRSKVEYISYADALKSGSSNYRNLDLTKAGIDTLSVNPGDVFSFKPLYVGQEVGTVKVTGEVRFPGSYGILRGERLSELLRRAGGLTEDAYPYGAVFTRISARNAEQESYRRAATDLQEAAVTAVTSGALGKDAQVSAQFLGTVAQRLEDAKAIGRVVIEADPAELVKHPEIDPILEPGDTLVIPKHPISVTVIGQVLNPGSQTFSAGSDLRQYIERAGGYTQAADGKRAFVILPNGTAQKFKNSFWGRSDQTIPPGSVVVVPRDAAPFNALAFSERVLTALSSLALTAAALTTISRN